jgi:hypothetical protein
MFFTSSLDGGEWWALSPGSRPDCTSGRIPDGSQKQFRHFVEGEKGNKMQLCRIICYSLVALHVSSDIFAHHQEHLNCITASGITHVCRCRLVSAGSDDDERKYLSKHVEQPRNNKSSYTAASCWSFSYIISWGTETWISKRKKISYPWRWSWVF